MVTVNFIPEFKFWRKEARALLIRKIPPETIYWQDQSDPQTLLPLDSSESDSEPSVTPFKVSSELMKKTETASFHRDSNKWSLFYRIFYRILHGEPHLAQVFIDPDIRTLESMVHSVRKDIHKMHAFVRFRETKDESGESRYVAWYRPDHLILRIGAPFFARRLNGLNWSILTEDESAHWDQNELTFGPGVPASHVPDPDNIESLWKTYYSSTFNPARIKLKTMKKEMPTRYWGVLPETELIADLIQDAPSRLKTFYESQPMSTSHWIPKNKPNFDELKESAKKCEACSLHKNATQVVFGEGPLSAKLVIVGEQPGDQEDLSGHPFVGPAGKLLNEALSLTHIEREQAYITNAVKHFKWKPIAGSKRRLHQKPTSQEISACNPWLIAELDLLQPTVLLCLGVTAAQAIFGKQVTLKELRGKVHSTARCPQTLVTIHPSALLRLPTEEAKKAEMELFLADLKTVHKLIAQKSSSSDDQ